MALYGIVADIHGNREALAAALECLATRRVERIACLGDIVGYNADPDECVALVRSRASAAIAGNHDLIGLGRLGFRRCSTTAEYSLKRTRRSLAPSSAAWLAALPPRRLLEEGVALVHAGVRDVQQDMATPERIRENAAYLREDFPGARVCFFGHSHEQKVYAVLDDNVYEMAVSQRLELRRDLVYFINPGAVDASRERSHKFAECAIFDSSAWTVEFIRCRYDCAATEAKATVLGYRINPLTDALYNLRRRFAAKL